MCDAEGRKFPNHELEMGRRPYTSEPWAISKPFELTKVKWKNSQPWKALFRFPSYSSARKARVVLFSGHLPVPDEQASSGNLLCVWVP